MIGNITDTIATEATNVTDISNETEPISRKVYEALWDAYISAVYCLNRYRHVHAGQPVRDLDEAEVAFRHRKEKLYEVCADEESDKIEQIR